MTKYSASMTKYEGVDIGYHESPLEPLNGEGRVGKAGINKHFTFERVLGLARGIRANVIVKAGKNAKWYLKRVDIEKLDDEINKQSWRDTSRYTMWVITSWGGKKENCENIVRY